MSGVIEVVASDGEKRTYSEGTISYLEDAGSKEQSSRTIGDELSIVMVAEVA